MTTSDSDSAAEASERPVIHTDEDWKKQVKAEDAALDEKLKAEAVVGSDDEPKDVPEPSATQADPGEKSPPESGKMPPLPPASFEILVGVMSTPAMVALGLIPDPATGKAESTPLLAKHFIDLLGVLETKTAGNLEPHEKSLLDAMLHQLRLTYVEESKS